MQNFFKPFLFNFKQKKRLRWRCFGQCWPTESNSLKCVGGEPEVIKIANIYIRNPRTALTSYLFRIKSKMDKNPSLDADLNFVKKLGIIYDVQLRPIYSELNLKWTNSCPWMSPILSRNQEVGDYRWHTPGLPIQNQYKVNLKIRLLNFIYEYIDRLNLSIKRRLINITHLIHYACISILFLHHI